MSYVTDGVFTDNDKIYFEIGSYTYKDRKVMIILLYLTTNKAGFVPSVESITLEEITDIDVCTRLISEHNDEMVKMANYMATKYDQTQDENYKRDMEKYLDSTIEYYKKDDEPLLMMDTHNIQLE